MLEFESEVQGEEKRTKIIALQVIRTSKKKTLCKLKLWQQTLRAVLIEKYFKLYLIYEKVSALRRPPKVNYCIYIKMYEPTE